MKYLSLIVLFFGMATYLSGMDCKTQHPCAPKETDSIKKYAFIKNVTYQEIKKQMPLYPYYKGSRFLLKHFVPLEIEKILNAQRDDKGTTFNNLPEKLGYQPVFNAPFLPDYILKFEHHANIARIEYAKKLQKIINQENLNLIKIPQKYFYCYHPCERIILTYSPKNQAHEANSGGMYVTVAKKIIPAHQQHISAAHIDQLETLIKRSGIIDLHEGNMMIDRYGFLYIIDTEPRLYEEFNNNQECALIVGLEAAKYWATQDGSKTIDNHYREMVIHKARIQANQKKE